MPDARNDSMLADPSSKQGIDRHPIANIQWVHRDLLQANTWNPNHVARPEWALLKRSIMEDGWATAIVVQELRDGDGETTGYEIVDGFHRWTMSGDPDVFALTDGYVPVVVVAIDDAHARISTIRFNRARGTHDIRRMSDIVIDLIDDLGLDNMQVSKRLSMDEEEVKRLYQRGRVTSRLAADEIGEAWKPQKK